MSTTTPGPVTTTPSTSSTSSSTASTFSLPPIAFPPSTSTPSTTPTSSSSSATSSTSSSSASNTSSSRSSSTTSSTSSTVPTTTPSQNTITTPSTTLPAVVTEVSTTFVSASESGTASAVAVQPHTNTGFFSNKGAVAGVFSVVGLIGLIILIALVVNAVRRHRAKQFDRELFAATQEAAATAPHPIFLDDDDDPEERLKHSVYGPGYGVGNNSYNGKTYSSDGSHTPYGQPPMEAYNMRDMVSHSVPVGEIYDPYATGVAAGGAAGIGVARARSAKANLSNVNPNVYAAAMQGGSPYPKFAMGPQATYTSGVAGAGVPFERGPNTNDMEFGGSRGQQYPQQSPPPQDYNNLGRPKSGSTAATHVSSPSLSHSSSQSKQQPYPVLQRSPSQTPSPPNPHAQVFPSHRVQPSGSTAEDPYGGVVNDDDEEDEVVEPKRVLKIANES